MTGPSVVPRLRIFIAHPSEILTDHLPNGDGLVSFGFIRRLADRGHELHVAAQRVDLHDPLPTNLHVYELAPNGGTSVVARLTFMVRMRLLFQRLRQHISFDVIHQMNPVFTGLSLSLLGVRTPLVLGTFVPRWEEDADALSSDRSDRVVTPVWNAIRRGISRVQQAQAAVLLIASPHAMTRISQPSELRHRIVEVPHGIDVTRFRQRMDVPTTRSILFLANVLYRKGIFTLLEAFPLVLARVPDAELVIAGGGADLEEVRRRVSHSQVGRITVLGPVPRSEVQDLMRSHAIYCLPSYGEPFATTVLEAMACGVPIVATRAGGIPDLVTASGGRLVEPRDASALAAALVEVLSSRPLQRSMGLYNRQRVEATFEAEKAVDRLELAYASVLPSRSRDRSDQSPQGLSVPLDVDAASTRTTSIANTRPLR